MASVDWKKNRGGTNQGFARMAHATRHDGKDVKYNNAHVNKELSYLNYQVGPKGGIERSAREEIERLNKRVKELDKLKPPKRIRKDRVTTISFEVPAPDGVSEKDEAKFFSIAYSEIAKTCGGYNNVSNGYVHNDEKHSYFDPNKKGFVTSRAHMHMQGVVWTDDFGVNGKNFEKRERYTELNKRIDERCRKELGISFLKEEVSQHDRKWRSVEEMKRDSVLKLNDLVEELEQTTEILNNKVSDSKERIDQLEQKNRVLEERNELLRNEMNNGSLLDKSKKLFAEKDVDRALELANELTEKRTQELREQVQLAENRAYEAIRERKRVVKENEALSKNYKELEQENDYLKYQNNNLSNENSYLRNALSFLQRAFDRVENFVKRFGRWKSFKDEFRNQDRDNYHEFQKLRHDTELGGSISERESRKLREIDQELFDRW